MTIKEIFMDIIDSSDYYELDDAKRFEVLKEIKKHIKNDGSPLMTAMQEIAENEVIVHIEDFYIHDLKLLSLLPNNSFLWLVRTKGTFLINLNADLFDDNGNWISSDFAKAVMSQMKIEKYYLIEKDKPLKKINEKSAIATLSIYSNIAYQNKQLKTGAW